MANNPTGWGAIGYGLAGGFERDRKALQAQEASKQYKEAAQGSKFEQEAEALRIQNQQLHKQTTMLQNQMAAKDLEQATDALVTNGNYEDFNKVIKTNPNLQQKLLNNYGIKSIRPIDWNNKQDLVELEKAGIPSDALSQMSEEDKRDGIGRAFYMTDAGHLASLDEFIQQTGYLNRVTSDKFKAYLDNKNKLANIGKKLTTGEVEAKSAEKWLAENPDKTWNDWKAQQDKPTTSEVEAQDFLQWKKIPGNENRTFSEYEQVGKPKSEKTMTTAALKDEYANLKVEASKGELPKDKQVRMDVLDKLFSTDNDEKRQILAEGIKITDKYRGNLFAPDTDIDDKDIIAAKLYAQQAGIKPDTKANRELKDQFNTVKTGKRLVKEVEKLGDEELSRGLYDTGIQKMKKLLSDKKFEDMSEEEKAKVLTSINMNTKLGMFLAKYIKSISGTAVAEAEYNRLKDLFSGSSFDNTQSLKEGVKAFVGELDTQFKDNMQTSLLDNPATTLDLAKRYKDLTKDEVKKEDVKEVTETPKEAPVVTDTYDRKYEKFKSLIGQVNPKNGKKLIGFEEEAPFNPIYEEVK